jgi:hypothetical protein
MKKATMMIALGMLVFSLACNKEDAIKPSADFTTNIQGNTLEVNQGFTVYLDNVQGEFLVYFRGLTEATTYSATDKSRQGTPFSNDLDSLEIGGYASAGEYQFTIVASSSGNWAQDYEQDLKSITITVP